MTKISKMGFLLGVMIVVGAMFESVFATTVVQGKGVCIDLSGEWQCKGRSVRLPGTLADAGIGELQTAKHFAAYTERTEKTALALKYRNRGAITYSRIFSLTEEEAAKPLEVFIERTIWSSRVRIDGRDIGRCDFLGAPHVHRIPAGVLSSGKHRLEVEIDNSPHYGVAMKAHGYGEWMQTVWHGMIGKIELRETNPLESVRIFATYPANGKVCFELHDGFEANANSVVSDDLSFTSFLTQPSPYTEGRVIVTATLSEEPKPWDEFEPRLYNVTFRDAKRGLEKKVRFGFRTLGRKGNKLMINGRALFVRADIDNCHFPLTGYPSMTKRDWIRFFNIQRNNGMNAIHMHTWTPPAAAFEAADETGMMIFCELGYWNEKGFKTSYAGKGNVALDDWLRREIKAIADTYGNHPSMVSTTFGNELGFCDFTKLNEWMEEHKKYDPRRLTMCSTARAVVKSDDFMVTHHYRGIGSTRGKFGGAANYDYEDVYSKAPIPVIAHEIGQWPVYPIWDEQIPKFNGLLMPWRWLPMREMAISNNTFRFAREFHSASMQTSRHFYKLETEGFLRTPSCNGITFLSMRDYTGQGEALIGWYDAFFNPKPALGEVPPFANLMRTVPCLAEFPKFLWTSNETFKARLLVRNFLATEIPAGTRWHWSFGRREGWAVSKKPIAAGELADVGGISVKLDSFAAPSRQELRFGDNQWHIYVLPRIRVPDPRPTNVVFTADPVVASKALIEGKRVFYTGKSVKSDITTYTPIYWSTGLFATNRKHIGFGAVIDADHSALAPTGCDYWMDEFWRKLFTDEKPRKGGARHAVSHRLEGLPRDFRPIVTVVPDLHHSYFISPMFEVKVGKGRLFVCGLNLDANSTSARLLKRTLWRYLASEDFNPKHTVSSEWFAKTFLDRAPLDTEKPVELDSDTRDMMNTVKAKEGAARKQ